jgi:uncharacterized membrane protein
MVCVFRRNPCTELVALSTIFVAVLSVTFMAHFLGNQQRSEALVLKQIRWATTPVFTTLLGHIRYLHHTMVCHSFVVRATLRACSQSSPSTNKGEITMETFTITTVYPDGRTESRDATAEEVAQREADLVAFAAEEEARQQAIADAEAAKASAQAKLAALGLTEAEIAAITGIS